MKSDRHKDPIQFYYHRHGQIQPAILDQIQRLIIKGSGGQIDEKSHRSAFLVQRRLRFDGMLDDPFINGVDLAGLFRLGNEVLWQDKLAIVIDNA